MDERKKKANRRRQEDEEGEVPGTSNWSELCPDLLRCVFKRLSLTSLNRARSVCSSWHSASRGCVPKQNQIPWLILFPSNEDSNKNKNKKNSRCVMFIPEDKDKVYTSRDLGVDFAHSRCLTTFGSWLLLSNRHLDLYILNPLTGERVDLPDTQYFRGSIKSDRACFWIDNQTKDYVVVMMHSNVFTKKGYNKWQNFALRWCQDIFCKHKDQKLYVHYPYNLVKIWDSSGDHLRPDGLVQLPGFSFNHYDYFPSFWDEGDHEIYWKKLHAFKTRIAVTVSGDFLMVTSIVQYYKTWYFRIYKNLNGKWEIIDSLGDEALIYDMGNTVIANGIPGIKRNSIYFSGKKDPHNIFVYDLTTHKMEPLPQCVLSSTPFSDARWFFPC